MPFHLSVFVGSSTVPKEILEYRYAARDAILNARMNPIMYEHVHRFFPDGSPKELSEMMINEADIFLGIYSGRYGKRVVGEMDWADYEYRYALSQKKPMILFIPEDNHPWRTQVDEHFETFLKSINVFYQKFVDPQGFSAQLSSLLLAPKYRDETAKRLIAEPIFGQPPIHSQYEANVFMIMPFKAEFTRVWLECIKPTIEGMGLTVKRGDNFFSKRSIMDDIWAATYRSQVIIADCTGKNANVFYELGIAHTLGKEYILLTQSMDDIPFDLQQRRTLLYSPDDYPPLELHLRQRLAHLVPKN